MQHDPKRWKTDYDRDGYVVVEDCLDAETLGRCRDALDRIAADVEALPPHLRRHVALERDYTKIKPGVTELSDEQMGSAIKLIMELPLFDPAFEQLIVHDPLLDVLQTLFASSEFQFLNYKAIVKAPFVSSRFVWHRDLPYLNHTTPNLITAMLCIDEMTEQNGATVVMPGTHRISHEAFDPADADIAEDALPDGERVTVCCPAGSAVLFHVNIIHGGGANRSPIPRRNVISIWRGPDTYPVKPNRYAYEGLMPRSADPAKQRQVAMSLSRLAQPVGVQPKNR